MRGPAADERWWRSDATYFGLLGEPEAVVGGTLFVAPEFADLPPGLVASVPGAAAVDDPTIWLEAIRARAGAVDARLLRAYLPDAPTPLGEHLFAQGFTPRPEIGLELPEQVRLPPRCGPFDRIRSEGDWADELELQRWIERGWCNGDIDPKRWVEMERAQCATGRTARFLLRKDGRPVASFGQTEGDCVKRPKSIVVHPCHRGQGHVATAFACLRAWGDGTTSIGCISVEGGAGHRSFLRLGLRPAFRFVEWSRMAS